MPRKPDLTIIGKTYNMLTVLSLTEERNSYGRRLYRCRCECGNERLATKQNLIKGEIKNCGCVLKKSKVDLVGKRFGKLVVIERVHQDHYNRCHLYRCKCDCGKEPILDSNELNSKGVRSCGCLVGETVKKLYIDGTAPCKLDGSRIRETNTSGATGVWYDKSRGKWCAEIMFKKKKYYLGRYGTKEEAEEARKTAEEKVFGDFLKWHGKATN